MAKEKVDYKARLVSFLESAPKEYGLDWTVKAEHRFHPIRRWRFDWVWLDAEGEPVGIAIEYDGIFFGNRSGVGGHSSAKGVMSDHEKNNEAIIRNWKMFKCNASSVNDGSFFNFMRAVLAQYASAGA